MSPNGPYRQLTSRLQRPLSDVKRPIATKFYHPRINRTRTYPRALNPWDTADIRDHEGCASGA